VLRLSGAAWSGMRLGEGVGLWQWLWRVLGLRGVLLLVWSKLSGEGSLAGVAAALVALLAITAGTLYQKRYCPDSDIRTAGAIQYGVSGLLALFLAAATETMQIHWTGEFVVALVRLILVLPVGAVGLLLALIRRGVASRVASLFYLAPPVTAVFGYLLFGETLDRAALLGLAVVVIGVALVNLPARPAARMAAAAR